MWIFIRIGSGRAAAASPLPPPPSSVIATAEPPRWPSRARGTVTTRDLSLPSGGGALSTSKPYSQDDKLLTLLRQRKTEEASSSRLLRSTGGNERQSSYEQKQTDRQTARTDIAEPERLKARATEEDMRTPRLTLGRIRLAAMAAAEERRSRGGAEPECGHGERPRIAAPSSSSSSSWLQMRKEVGP
ncbi:hypothetical protein NL676_030087 [Syzygium grande]|nr:hypothetical protein NL676_030087 [Syzygium grande]